MKSPQKKLIYSSPSFKMILLRFSEKSTRPFYQPISFFIRLKGAGHSFGLKNLSLRTIIVSYSRIPLTQVLPVKLRYTYLC